MADNTTRDAEELESFFEQMTESYVTALDKNLDAQSDLMEQWMESIEAATSDDQIEEQAESSVRAYEAWMDAAETSFDRMGDYMEGESVDAEEFRDIWLSAANRAFKETMSTTAFAAATGQSVDGMLQMRQQLDEATEDTLHALGFATAGDVQEIGERLVQTERRQHALEQDIEALSDQQGDALDRLDGLKTTLDSVDERADDLDRLEQMETQLDRLEQMETQLDRLEQMEATLDSVDERAADLDQLGRLDRLDEMVERLNALDQRTAQLDRLDDIFTQLEDLDDELDGLDELDEVDDRLEEIEATLSDLRTAENESNGEEDEE